jgi:predicted nucleic acid-binding protein
MNGRVTAERFVDTNIIIRHLAADHGVHSPAATALFGRFSSGEESGWTSHLAIAEVIWVLRGPTYGAERGKLASTLTDFLRTSGVRIQDREILLDALLIYGGTNLSFIDAYHAALVTGAALPELYSFDKGLDRIPGVTRIEP